jgi:hypothetical protein
MYVLSYRNEKIIVLRNGVFEIKSELGSSELCHNLATAKKLIDLKYGRRQNANQLVAVAECELNFLH